MERRILWMSYLRDDVVDEVLVAEGDSAIERGFVEKGAVVVSATAAKR